MSSLSETWPCRKLRKLVEAILDRPWWFVGPQLALFVFCAAYAARHLKFSTDRADLISESVKYQRDFRAFKREFQTPDSLFATVESESPERNRLFVERLAARVQAEPTLFANTIFKGDLSQMGRKGMFFLSPKNLDEIATVCRNDWPFIQTFAQVESLNGAVRALNRQFRDGLPGGVSPVETLPALRLFHRAFDLASASLNGPMTNSYPDLSAFFGGDRLYLNFDSGRLYLLMTHAARSSVEERAVSRLWELVRETQSEVSGVNAGITGEPVLNADEMREVTQDVNWATILSLALVAVIFIAGFHEVARPLIATFCLLVGIVYALGFTALTVGHLNILSVTLLPILVGVAIDFGVHFISRYEEELSHGRAQRQGLKRAFSCTGVGIITSGFTIAGGFFAMIFTDFKGIQEMGFLAGCSLLLCLLPMLTLLPLLLARRDRQMRPTEPRVRRIPTFIERAWLRRPGFVLCAACVVTVLAATQASRLRFDYNLLNLQSKGLPAAQIERKLIESSSHSVLYGVVLADSLEQAAKLQKELEALEPVASVNSMVNYLTDDSARKLERISEIKAKAAALKVRDVDAGAVNLSELNESLYILQGYLGWAPYFLERGETEVAAEVESLRDAVMRLRAQVGQGAPETVQRLTAFQRGMLGSARDLLRNVRQQDTAAALGAGDLPAFLRERFISRSGKYLLEVHPKADLWQRANQEEFIRAVRTVAPNVTGSVVQIHEYTGLLRANFLSATGYAAGIIALILFLQFRRFSSVALAFLPVALGLLWTLGLMGFLNIPFNPVNIMALTLLSGIGVANGIHILVRSGQDRDGTILSKSTGKAVIVSAFTTMAGFGSLGLANHQGIASLGIVMGMGAGLCMLAALAVLPAILSFRRQRTELGETYSNSLPAGTQQFYRTVTR